MASLIRAGEADLGALSHVIAEAFHDLPPSRWLVPDPDRRRQIFPGYFLLYLEHALASGVIWTTERRDAAALWFSYSQDAPPPPDDYVARLTAITAPWSRRFLAFDAALDRRHPAGIPHRHLAILAVQPGRQGQGTGTMLLDYCHAELDMHTRLPAYLEAADQRTRHLYLLHGYGDLGPPIHLPGGPMMYPMWRDPLPQRSPLVRAEPNHDRGRSSVNTTDDRPRSCRRGGAAMAS
jgi:GNAT superfamily N-acetyltransferase